MSLQAQGRILKTKLPGPDVGVNQSGMYTMDSFEYRGRPYSLLNAFDRAAIDAFNEVEKPAVQRGQRVIGVYMRTGKIMPN